MGFKQHTAENSLFNAVEINTAEILSLEATSVRNVILRVKSAKDQKIKI
jgi:hypothetical protein